MKATVSPQVIEALTRRFGAIIPVGAGAWSTAFRFRRDGENLVVRVGPHVADFRVDAEMSDYSSADLPIPIVSELEPLGEPHDGVHLCVSTFAPGSPLEAVEADHWVALVPTVVDLLDALRAVSPPAGSAVPTWPTVLLDRDGSEHSGDEHSSDDRLAGWRERLEALPDHLVAYQRLTERLEERCALPHVANVEPTLLHCDLINRNVHVRGTTITGVFDWGCRRWGDHLYDLAWFEFWAPWYPKLDIGLLRSTAAKRWGAEPDRDRFDACLVHIAADHLVYNAVTNDPAGGLEVKARAEALMLI